MNIRQKLISNQSSGFTLVELLAVMAILGVILLMAIPVFQRSIADFRLQQAAEQMAWDIRAQQQAAIAQGQDCQLEFFRVSNQYRIVGTETRRVSFAPGIRINSVGLGGEPGNYVLSFRMTGTPNLGGTIALTNDYGSFRYVVVAPVTGRTRVSNIYSN